MKGKKHPLVDEEDIAAMYTGKRNVLLWCYLRSASVVQSGSSGKKGSTVLMKRTLHLDQSV